MRFIPTRFHGILDYIVGIFMIIAPWVLDFSDNDAATWTLVIAGVLVLLQTVMTDLGLGVLLAISPWLFGFADRVYMPHLIIGVFSILASLTTHRVPSRSYTTSHVTTDHNRHI